MPSTVGRPERTEFSAHYAPFIAAVPDGDILDLLASSGARRDATVGGITELAAAAQPPAGKWSIREVLGHLADMERVMAYRALRIARADRAPIVGVDQDVYTANSYANERTIADLRSCTQFEAARSPCSVPFRRRCGPGSTSSKETR